MQGFVDPHVHLLIGGLMLLSGGGRAPDNPSSEVSSQALGLKRHNHPPHPLTLLHLSPPQVLKQALAQAAQYALSLGVTTLGDMGRSDETAWQDLEEVGRAGRQADILSAFLL
jgi:predicted amidohydrolase YtcJ